MDSGVIEGGLNVTLTIRLLMHGKVKSLICCLSILHMAFWCARLMALGTCQGHYLGYEFSLQWNHPRNGLYVELVSVLAFQS